MTRLPKFAFYLGVIGVGVLVGSCRADPGVAVSPASAELPRIMLWAWHGQHDLTFLEPETAGVAFLAGTVRLTGGSVDLETGAGPIDAPQRTVLVPVVRIETDHMAPPRLDDVQLEELVTGIVGFAGTRFAGLQLDFDATLSEREFYLRLIRRLRRKLDPAFFSLTALPSWCLGDVWLPSDLTDEIVPMLFRMGRDAPRVRAHLTDGGDFAPVCRSALGLADDEPRVPVPDDRRLYLFSTAGWSAEVYADLLGATKGDA